MISVESFRIFLTDGIDAKSKKNTDRQRVPIPARQGKGTLQRDCQIVEAGFFEEGNITGGGKR